MTARHKVEPYRSFGLRRGLALPLPSGARAAFTLIELIVVIAILSIVSIISFQFVISTAQWYNLTLRQSRTDEMALATVTRLEREIRMLRSPVTASNTLFQFAVVTGQTNTLQCVSSNLMWNGYPLADGASVTMTYYDATNGVTTNLGLIRRIGLNIRVADGNAVSDLNVNLFCPGNGTIK